MRRLPLPVLDARLLRGTEQEIQHFAGLLRDACVRVGTFYLVNHPVPLPRCQRVLEAARTFFALPPEAKYDLHISRSAHFRGYSEMKNERDWREQMHFGLELPAISGADPLRLQGPNLWPHSLGAAWRRTLLSFLHEVGAFSRELLQALAIAFDLPRPWFSERMGETPYLLLKLICYHPRPPGEPPRPGVAPHCDWSWITFLLQDDVGGLEVQTPGGEWREATPMAGSFVVNLGELTEFATAGRVRATPHQVRNHSGARSRLSIPIFINPSLLAVISPALRAEQQTAPPDDSHIHRVLAPGTMPHPFGFGESEWRRKGLGQWCHAPACCPPATQARGLSGSA